MNGQGHTDDLRQYMPIARSAHKKQTDEQDLRASAKPSLHVNPVNRVNPVFLPADYLWITSFSFLIPHHTSLTESLFSSSESVI
jgi:hypothetical protein